MCIQYEREIKTKRFFLPFREVYVCWQLFVSVLCIYGRVLIFTNLVGLSYIFFRTWRIQGSLYLFQGAEERRGGGTESLLYSYFNFSFYFYSVTLIYHDDSEQAWLEMLYSWVNSETTFSLAKFCATFRFWAIIKISCSQSGIKYKTRTRATQFIIRYIIRCNISNSIKYFYEFR